MNTTLDKLKIGQECQVIKIDIKNRERKRHLLDMGITRGVHIKIKRVAPMGDPVSIELRDYVLSINKKDLSHIFVKISK